MPGRRGRRRGGSPSPRPTETPDTWWFIMLSGAIAICAMILPGISGAFILLLLGKYQFIMQAVGDLNVPGHRDLRRGRRGGHHQLFAPALVAAQALARRDGRGAHGVHGRFAQQGVAVEGGRRDLHRQPRQDHAARREQRRARPFRGPRAAGRPARARPSCSASWGSSRSTASSSRRASSSKNGRSRPCGVTD